MSKSEDFSDRVSSRVQIECPDFATLPANVKEKFENLPTKVNFFRMMGYSPGTFVEIIDLTNAIFKNLTLKDYHKELVVLSVAAYADLPLLLDAKPGAERQASRRWQVRPMRISSIPEAARCPHRSKFRCTRYKK